MNVQIAAKASCLRSNSTVLVHDSFAQEMSVAVGLPGDGGDVPSACQRHSPRLA